MKRQNQKLMKCLKKPSWWWLMNGRWKKDSKFMQKEKSRWIRQNEQELIQ